MVLTGRPPAKLALSTNSLLSTPGLTAASGVFLVQPDIFSWNSREVEPYMSVATGLEHLSINIRIQLMLRPFHIAYPGLTALTVQRSLSSRDHVLVIASSAALVPPYMASSWKPRAALTLLTLTILPLLSVGR